MLMLFVESFKFMMAVDLAAFVDGRVVAAPIPIFEVTNPVRKKSSPSKDKIVDV